MIDLHRLQKPRAVGLLALGALLFFFAACQLVAGVQSRELDPIASGCALPGGSGPKVRFANLAPNADVLDVCIRSSGSSWGEPIVLNGGSGCTTASGNFPKGGFAYSEISIPFSAPGSKVDVKTVKGGGSCTSATVAELDGVSLQANPYVTTLIALGGAAGQPKKLAALKEYDSTNNTGNGLYRFVNAFPGIASMDVGAGAGDQLPTTIPLAYNLGGGIPYGGTLTKNQKGAFGSVADNGYLPILGANYAFALTPHGQSDAVVLFPSVEVASNDASVYGIGLAFNDAYPLSGLSCTESGNPGPSSTNSLLMSCSASSLPTLSFDVFNPALYGPNSPDFNAREVQYQAGPTNPIATRTSDVMCLVEVDTQNDQNNIIAVGKNGNYNYSYVIDTNLTTPFSNGGATQSGGTCPTSGQPACAGVPSSTIDPAFSCMEQHCSSIPGSAAGFLNTTTDCLLSNCMGALEGLFIAYPSCFDCVIDNVASSLTYSGSLTTCTSNPSPPLGYEGFNSSMILSKYPIKNQDSYILTSSNYRRTVLYSQVEFPGNLTVDFYCGFFITPLIATTVPYQGCFGADGGASLGEYLQENYWEAQQLTAWVNKKSGASGNAAVIVGDWRVGLGQPANTMALPDAAFPPPTAIGDSIITYMASQHLWQAPSGLNWPAASQCNNCPGNVNQLNVGSTESYFTLQPFLYNWSTGGGGSAMVDEQLIFTQNVIAVGDAGNVANAPISPYYGLNFHVLRPAGK